MHDPIPAGFITLPEALQRIAVHVSEAHLEIAKAELQEIPNQSPQSVRAKRAPTEQVASSRNRKQPGPRPLGHPRKHGTTGISGILPLPNSSWRSKPMRSRRWFGIPTLALYSGLRRVIGASSHSASRLFVAASFRCTPAEDLSLIAKERFSSKPSVLKHG